MTQESSYKDKKVITIGVVRELTGLTERQIRYYEERKLIFPDRTAGGSRKYSFTDIELLMEIAEKIEDGVQTFEIRQEMIREKKNEAFHTSYQQYKSEHPLTEDSAFWSTVKLEDCPLVEADFFEVYETVFVTGIEAQ